MKIDEKRGALWSARPRLSSFAQRLLAEWERLNAPSAEARVVVAVSGGADSTALLLALDELLKDGRLALRLIVAHLDHGLRGAAGGADALWVSELAHELGYEIKQGRAAMDEQVAAPPDNLEQAARRARYQFLAATARECAAQSVLTAHTMDDQAETVLLRLLRGSGADGLSGMEAVRSLEAGGCVLLIRPLLAWAGRSWTEEYCRERGVEFRRDEMNEDARFARVRVRKQLLPLLQTFNGRIVEALARTASLLREDAATLNSAAAELLAAASVEASGEESGDTPPLLRVPVLRAAPSALRRRAFRQWLAAGRGDLRRLEMVHLLAIEGLLAGERGGRVIELPGGAMVSRKRSLLQLHAGPRRNTELLS